MGPRGQRRALATLTTGKKSGTFLQEAGWSPGTVWTGAENLAPHRDRISGPSSP
jgi:hypothetical protein